jgi:hypothetical protein
MFMLSPLTVPNVVIFKTSESHLLAVNVQGVHLDGSGAATTNLTQAECERVAAAIRLTSLLVEI